MSRIKRKLIRRKDDNSKKETENKMRLLKENQLTFTIGGFIAIVLFLISNVYVFTTWKTDVDNKFKNINYSFSQISKTFDIQKQTVAKLQNDNVDVKIRLATIETKLTNIECLLVEIKKDIKDNKRLLK